MAVSPLYILLERLNLFNIETLRLEYLSGKTAKNCLLKLIEKAVQEIFIYKSRAFFIGVFGRMEQ